MSKLKTKTYGKDSYGPEITVLKGRHTARNFNKAYINECGKNDQFIGYDIQYGFFRVLTSGIKRSDIWDLKAEIYTYVEW